MSLKLMGYRPITATYRFSQIPMKLNLSLNRKTTIKKNSNMQKIKSLFN